MATKGNNTGNELENVGEIISKSELFIENHGKKLIIAVVAITVIVVAVIGFKHGYIEPQQKKAAAVMFKGEQYFAKDSFALALNGNGTDYIGFEGVIKDYGMTKSANLAKAYAGICYYKMGDAKKAMEMLKSFDGKDKMISPAITGLIGDCYVTLGDVKEGINYFKKAATEADNNVVSPEYLKKAGRAYESLGQYKDAVEVYTTIKNKYYSSMDAADIDKYITRASASAK